MKKTYLNQKNDFIKRRLVTRQEWCCQNKDQPERLICRICKQQQKSLWVSISKHMQFLTCTLILHILLNFAMTSLRCLQAHSKCLLGRKFWLHSSALHSRVHYILECTTFQSALHSSAFFLFSQAEKEDLIKKVDHVMKGFQESGCTIASDGWIDRAGRSVVNAMATSEGKSVFLDSKPSGRKTGEFIRLCLSKGRKLFKQSWTTPHPI